MQKIRFATAILDFSKSKGGAERYLVDLCTWMADHGFEVHVYAERWEEVRNEIHLHQVRTILFPKSLRLLSFATRATKAMEQGHYDVTLGVGNTLRADILQPHGGVHWAWFWRSLRAYDHPLVWMVKFLGRVLSPKQWIQGYIESAPYKKEHFRKIIAISDMVKEDINRWYGVSKDQITVIYNGVDIERFHPRNRQYGEEVRKRYGIGDEFVILFVSNNFKMKGLSYLIGALAKIKQEGRHSFKLLILGRDRQAPYLSQAEKAGLSEEILFAGSTSEPEKFYGAADLLVHPTFYDACSLTVLEAMASGLPVITTDHNGASGGITDGKEGFVIDDGRNVEDLSGKISYYFDVEKRKEASLLARRRAEHFSAAGNCKAIVRIFHDSVRGRKG
ncbi:MAG: glycosyltransferase family 4 protein [Thermodesulfobacteriota bacterium]